MKSIEEAARGDHFELNDRDGKCLEVVTVTEIDEESVEVMTSTGLLLFHRDTGLQARETTDPEDRLRIDVPSQP